MSRNPGRGIGWCRRCGIRRSEPAERARPPPWRPSPRGPAAQSPTEDGAERFRRAPRSSNCARRPGRLDPIVGRRRIVVPLARLRPIGRRRDITDVLHDDSVRIPNWERIFRHVLAESDDCRFEPRVILGSNVQVSRRRRHHHALEHGNDLRGLRPSPQKLIGLRSRISADRAWCTRLPPRSWDIRSNVCDSARQIAC